jgi:hypothetical protein
MAIPSSNIIFTSAAHGQYAVTGEQLDWAIATYLPASPASLREILTSVVPSQDWTDLRDVGSLLIVLAYLAHP